MPHRLFEKSAILAAIRPRARYLTSVDYAPDGTRREGLIGLRAGGPKDNILANGFRDRTPVLGCGIACRVGSSSLIYRSLVRALITSVVLAAGLLLAGCNSDEISLATNAKANQPVPPKLIAAMTEKD